MNPAAPLSPLPGPRVTQSHGDRRRQQPGSDAFRRALQEQAGQGDPDQPGRAPEPPTPPALQQKGLPIRKSLSSTAQHVDVVA